MKDYILAKIQSMELERLKLKDEILTKKHLTISELEAILDNEEDTPLEILPNGEIRAVGTGKAMGLKPLTMREDLGGEYGMAMYV